MTVNGVNVRKLVFVLEMDVCNVKVKVISNEKCVPKHKLLVMDMLFNTTKRLRKKFDPRVHVWKLEERM